MKLFSFLSVIHNAPIDVSAGSRGGGAAVGRVQRNNARTRNAERLVLLRNHRKFSNGGSRGLLGTRGPSLFNHAVVAKKIAK